MTIATPQDVSAARRALGLTQAELGAVVRLKSDDRDNLERTVRRWETEEGALPGPAAVAIEALLSGWTPDPNRRVTDAHEARKNLGLTLSQLASLLRMGANGERSVRRWAKGGFVPGPAAVALEALLSGWTPPEAADLNQATN